MLRVVRPIEGNGMVRLVEEDQDQLLDVEYLTSFKLLLSLRSVVVGPPVGHLFSNAVNQEQGKQLLKIKDLRPSKHYLLSDIIRVVPKGVWRVRPHRAPKNRGAPSYWTLAFFPVKPIYSRHKYAKSGALSSYRLVSFILLN
jgi:hypothetical protein